MRSKRSMPFPIAEHEYSDDFETRKVRPDGAISWTGGRVFVGEALAGEQVGLEDVAGCWHVHLGPMRLGKLHGRSGTILPLEPPTEE